MLGYIKEKAGRQGRGQVGCAPAPQPGNWGGSFLTVPKNAKHKDEAVKLAAVADRARAADQGVPEVRPASPARPRRWTIRPSRTPRTRTSVTRRSARSTGRRPGHPRTWCSGRRTRSSSSTSATSASSRSSSRASHPTRAGARRRRRSMTLPRTERERAGGSGAAGPRSGWRRRPGSTAGARSPRRRRRLAQGVGCTGGTRAGAPTPTSPPSSSSSPPSASSRCSTPAGSRCTEVSLHRPPSGLGRLHNYTGLLDDEFFWTALRNTFTLGVISTVPQLMMALGLAHLLNYRAARRAASSGSRSWRRTPPRSPRRRWSSSRCSTARLRHVQLGCSARRARTTWTG